MCRIVVNGFEYEILYQYHYNSDQIHLISTQFLLFSNTFYHNFEPAAFLAKNIHVFSEMLISCAINGVIIEC